PGLLGPLSERVAPDSPLQSGSASAPARHRANRGARGNRRHHWPALRDLNRLQGRATIALGVTQMVGPFFRNAPARDSLSEVGEQTHAPVPPRMTRPPRSFSGPFVPGRITRGDSRPSDR